MTTKQMEVWSGEFGHEYTSRNQFKDLEAFDELYIKRFGSTREALNRLQLENIPRDARIVEVGSNIGNQLAALHRMGFSRLYGVELQREAVNIAHQERPEIDLVQGSALELPFRDGFASLVFTNNVLIHISPADLPTVMDEMHRVSQRWIWGFEYFAPQVTEVKYRGHTGLLWKADYAQMFLDRFSDLRLVAAQTFPYLDEPGLTDKMYLLERQR